MFMKILLGSVIMHLQCGGIKFLTPEQVAFIDQWEVENYRRKVSQSAGAGNKLNNKIAVVTGGAQGFGAGIAEALIRLNVNVVIADLNEETGNSFVSGLNSLKRHPRQFLSKQMFPIRNQLKDDDNRNS